MFVKVCGLKTKQQIDWAVEFGYDAIGIVFCKKSKRHCDERQAIDLAEYAEGKITRFVVGVTYDDVSPVAELFDYVQIYQPKKIPRLAFASKEKPPVGLQYAYWVYDASKGSGVEQVFPEWLYSTPLEARLILAGGLTPENVCAMTREIKPFGVDVSSGVEQSGVKDANLMHAFIHAAKNCNT